MKSLKELTELIKLIKTDINTQAEMLYKFVHDAMSNEEATKYTIKLLLLACRKHPELKEDLKKLSVLLAMVVDHV